MTAPATAQAIPSAPKTSRAAFGGALLAAAMFFSPMAVSAAPVVGQGAPDFSGVDTNGKTHSLADFKGSTVVLEWTNHECPYTVKHYEAGAMQQLQKDATDDGVVWLSIISSAPGEQGYVKADRADELTTYRGAHPSAVILDPEGTIGRAYAARTTPEMFIIDAEGTIVYMGAIDDEPGTWNADPLKADNYVRNALAEMQSGQPISVASTKPYGCSVKYAN